MDGARYDAQMYGLQRNRNDMKTLKQYIESRVDEILEDHEPDPDHGDLDIDIVGRYLGPDISIPLSIRIESDYHGHVYVERKNKKYYGTYVTVTHNIPPKWENKMYDFAVWETWHSYGYDMFPEMYGPSDSECDSAGVPRGITNKELNGGFYDHPFIDTHYETRMSSAVAYALAQRLRKIIGYPV